MMGPGFGGAAAAYLLVPVLLAVLAVGCVVGGAIVGVMWWLL